MYVVERSSQPRYTLPGLEHVTLAGSDQGLARLSVWQQAIAPGGATPPHRHDCEEVVVVTAGRGELHVEGRVIEFGPDSTLVIPANVPHQILNTGADEIRLVAAFSTAPVEVFLPDGAPIALPWRS
jgi:mannose-6-phosphate isomerase-like protein (cupin superfamily)